MGDRAGGRQPGRGAGVRAEVGARSLTLARGLAPSAFALRATARQFGARGRLALRTRRGSLTLAGVLATLAWVRRPELQFGHDGGRDACRPQALRGRPQPVYAGLPETRRRAPWLRTGRPYPRARACTGSDAPTSRQRLPGRRSRAALSRARHRGGLLRQLRVRLAAGPRAHASACRPRGMDANGQGARGPGTRVRARARRRASPPGGRPFRARHGHQLLGRLVERDDAPAGAHALSRPAQGHSAREGHPHLRGTRDHCAARDHAHVARARRRLDRRRRPESTRRCRLSRCRFS